jgi:hypothetical protein
MLNSIGILLVIVVDGEVITVDAFALPTRVFEVVIPGPIILPYVKTVVLEEFTKVARTLKEVPADRINGLLGSGAQETPLSVLNCLFVISIDPLVNPVSLFEIVYMM